MSRFTREQVRRRQLIAGVLAIVLVLVIGGCTAGVIGALRGGDQQKARTESKPFRADDDAMVVEPSPADAAALKNFPGSYQIAPDESIGIDVSSYQEEIAWDLVAGDGIAFAYIKATEGSGFTDTHFRKNWDGARAAGITPGAYHYFTLCSPGADQARDFLAAAPVDDSALPPALDLEFDGACDARPEAADAQAEVDAFIAIVEEAWGRRMVMYSSSDWRSHYGLPSAEGRPAWLYSDAGRPEDEWAVWQVRFDGSVDGIQTDVDIDVVRPEVLREHARIG